MQEHPEVLLIGLISVSDRASAGVYQDEGIPALEDWFSRAIAAPAWRTEKRLIPDERAAIEAAPEATLAVADKPMPGFGEQMRRISLEFVPTAILSRQVAVIRYRRSHEAKPAGSLIINLPGQPKSIRETLEGLKDKDGKQLVPGIFAAVPYCIDLIGGPYIETNENVIKAFRPKSALRPKKEQPL